MKVDSALLRRDGRPLVAVVRLDGQLPQLDAQRAREEITALLAEWKAAGLAPQALEIDHDCASARLPGYTRFLAELRQALPAGMHLGITALPAWLSSPDLDALLAQVDGSALQVHGVSAPEQGLFDADKALDWARRWSERSDRPFLLALPAYGAGLIAGTGGAQVESEAPLAWPASAASSAPTRARSPGCWTRCAGIAPNTWPGSSGSACRWPATGAPGPTPPCARSPWASPGRRAPGHRRAAGQPGLPARIQPHQRGQYPAPLPGRVEITARDCQAFDALPGYRMQRSNTGLVLERQARADLAAGQRRALGWARCSELDQGGIHVRP